MNNDSRRSSRSSDDNPLADAELYYLGETNPATAPKGSRFARTRTMSTIEPRTAKSMSPSLLTSNNQTSSSDNDATRTPTPAPIDPKDDPKNVQKLRRGSIVSVDTSTDTTDLAADPTNVLDIQPDPASYIQRRSSLDLSIFKPQKFYIRNIDETLEELLKSEDTDHNCQITIEDTGPKVMRLGTANSNGFHQFALKGTYQLSNLLQELTIAKIFGRNQVVLDEQRLRENPVGRMKRLINTMFWKNLTRKMTRDNIVEMARDTKITEEYVDDNGKLIKNKESYRLYVPHDRPDQYSYFASIKDENPDIRLDVQMLPEKIDSAYIRSIYKKPGLLALQAWADPNDKDNLLNEPYVVPGGRFNEFYGWDSYMIVIGLLIDATPKNKTNLKLSRGMTENFIYEITYYKKILNANRSYYLGRSQPPFLTDMALRVFNKTIEIEPESLHDAIDFLKRATLAAIKEYETVWCCKPRLDEETGLSCYHPEGEGVPPETEPSHFSGVLKPYMEKYNVSQEEFIEMYNNKKVLEPDLDEYFLHDRAVRESGHDTSYRLEGRAAYLATVDLNALLYKYETDISFILESFFNNKLQDSTSGAVHTAEVWRSRAEQRKKNITKYLWNEEDSIFYDYHIKEKKQTMCESATCLWPLWSRAATEEQADKLVMNSLHKFEEAGGLVSGTLKSRGEVSIDRPSRQWDYPYGWAPQQILAWIGLTNYNYAGAARRLAYRWLYMMTKAFVDYNGVIVEKYNVLQGAVTHKVDAEYGNQGLDFKGAPTEGFGWVNASYIFGLTFLNLQAQRSLGALISPELFLGSLSDSQKELYT